MTYYTLHQTAVHIKNAQTSRILCDNTTHGLVSHETSGGHDCNRYITPVGQQVYKVKNQKTGNCIYYNVNKKSLLTWQDLANEDGEIVPIARTTFKLKNANYPGILLFGNKDYGTIGYPDNGNTDGIWSTIVVSS